MTDSAPTLHDRILELLREHGAPLGPRDISSGLGANYETVRTTLGTLKDRRLVVQPARGYYTVPPAAGPSPEAAPARTTGEAYRREVQPAPAYLPGDLFRIVLDNGTTAMVRMVIVQDGPPLSGSGGPGSMFSPAMSAA